MAPKKVWLVSKGDYSDYRIVAVFSTLAKAEKYTSGFNGFYIEERELNPPVDSRGIPAGYSQWQVNMFRDGEVRTIWQYSEPTEDQINIWENGYGLELDAIITAKTGRAAIKITNEKRTKIIALDKWIEHDDLEGV